MEVGLVVVAMAALWVLGAIFSCAGTVLWVWMLIDCLMNEPSEGNDKIIWVAVILLAPVIGAVVYFFGRRPQRIAQYGK